MPTTVNKFLAKDEVKYLLQQLKSKFGADVDAKFTTVINSSSTNTQIPGAKAVYDSIVAATTKIEYVTGPIASVTPVANTLYAQRDDASDPSWALYVHDGTNWIMVSGGDVSDDWAHSELEAMTTADIDELMNEVFPPAP
jgi:hypothetical protein